MYNNNTIVTILCRAIIDGGMISHNEKLQAFTIKGTGGNVHAVRLFPEASCTCPASEPSCYHILAARMSIGMEDKGSRHRVNFTLLRRNARSKKDKTSGRKRPRVDDYDITPAPDSIKNTLIKINDFPAEKVPTEVINFCILLYIAKAWQGESLVNLTNPP